MRYSNYRLHHPETFRKWGQTVHYDKLPYLIVAYERVHYLTFVLLIKVVINVKCQCITPVVNQGHILVLEQILVLKKP